MYYRDRGACFEVCVCGGRRGGGQDSTGAIPRRQAGFYPVIFYYPLKKWGGHAPPCSAVPVFLHAQERIRNSELIASVHKIN